MNKAELLMHLRASAIDTPYSVEETKEGFRMTLNIVDAKWYTIFQKNGIDSTFVVDGNVDQSEKTVATTDTMKTIKWHAGGLAPSLGGSLSVKKGELYGKGFGSELGVSESGKIGEAVRYSYDLGSAKKWLDAELAEAGYRRVLGKTAKVGIAIAIAGVALAIIVALALLVTLL